jgi:hypothetical protein
MVIGAHPFGVAVGMLFAAEKASAAGFDRLDAPTRAAVVMALLGLTLVGLFLITFVMIGGHWVRKLARHRPGRRRFGKSVETEGQRRDALQNILPEMKSSDTVLLDSSSKDTKVNS